MKSKFYFRLLAAVFLIVLCNEINFGQTSAWGDYITYNRKTSFSSVGYLTTHLTFSDSAGAAKYFQKGIFYSNDYMLGNLGKLVFDENNEINLSLVGAFMVGFGAGNEVDTIKTRLVSDTTNEVTYYVATIDLFSMDLAADYTFVFGNGYAAVARFQVGIVDIGGTVGILSGGYFQRNGIGIISIIPFSFKPSFYIDFGRSILGVALYYNPRSILDYSFSPNDNGIKFNSYMVQRYAMEVSFTF